MITIIFGAPGSGKTSLNATFLQQTFRRQGEKLLNQCREKIEEINRGRTVKLTPPEQPPIFSDFKVTLLTDYETVWSPYFINGYYFGIANENMPTQYVLPESHIFLSEAQRYFDSRKNATFPRWVSEAFEKHRHYGLEIVMDVQRSSLIDLNIREICKNFIEVQEMIHEKNAQGKILQTTFHCREFHSLSALTRYLTENDPTYTETTYVNKGNIFRAFNSYEHFTDFIPAEGKDFTCLPFIADPTKIPKELEMYYRTGEPKEYRGKTEPAKKK